MTALSLQEALCKEIEKITKEIILFSPKGENKKLEAFPQSLTLRETDDIEEDPFPYAIVRLDSGHTYGADSSHVIKTVILLGVYDEGKEQQGHRSILTMIQRFQERFQKCNILDNQYIMQDDIQWVLQDDENYPYYYGGIEVNWEAPSIRREDFI